MASYEFQHTEVTTADPATVWELWANVDRWTEWDGSLTSVELAGPFEVGTEGTMVIPGQPPIAFRLVEVDHGRSFTDETGFAGSVLRFEHVLRAVDGGAEVTHRVEIDGDAALGPMVTADVPDAVRALVKLAEASSHA